jgi:hypothetical protein
LRASVVGMVAAGSVIIGSVGQGVVSPEGHTIKTVVPVIRVDLPRCATEDSTLCVWVGSEQGNGHGPIVINGLER